MVHSIYVSLPFLPFATEKSEKDDRKKVMQSSRDSTRIKHEGK